MVLKRRFFYLEQILKTFIEICSEKRGELKAEIKSAKSLTQDEIKKITDELSINFKSKIKLNYHHLNGTNVKIVNKIMHEIQRDRWDNPSSDTSANLFRGEVIFRLFSNLKLMI